MMIEPVEADVEIEKEIIEVSTKIPKYGTIFAKEPLMQKKIVSSKESLNGEKVRPHVKKIANLKQTSKPITPKRKTVMGRCSIHDK